MKRFAFLLIILPLLAACSVTKDSIITTGLFNDNLDAMLAAFDKVEQGKTTKGDLTDLGFNLAAPNIQHLPGPDSMKAIFGDMVFQSALNDKDKVESLLAELNHYEMYSIPYKEIESETDQIYFSNKETHREGVDVLLTFVLKDGVVIYRGKRHRAINETEKDYGFAQGLINTIRDAAGIGNFARQIEKLAAP